MYLKQIKTLCKQYWDSGKIVPIEFEFPCFAINEENFKKAVLEIVSDRISFALETNLYETEKFLPNLTYQQLLNAQKTQIQNCQSKQEKGLTVFCEQILPIKMARDNNLNPLKIARSSLNSLCSQAMQSKLFELNHLASFSAVYGEQVSTYNTEKDKFAASMIMLNHKLPSVYNNIRASLEQAPFKELMEELKKLETQPSFSVIQHINNIDKEMAQEKFSKEIKLLLNNQKFSLI